MEYIYIYSLNTLCMNWVQTNIFPMFLCGLFWQRTTYFSDEFYGLVAAAILINVHFMFHCILRPLNE